jgi:hypothetical protein
VTIVQLSLQRIHAALLLLILLLNAGCGGGGGSDAAATTPAPTLPPPSSLSYSSPQVYPLGTAIAPLSPTVTGTVTSYSVAPALPAGLSIDATSGQISGTPTAAAAVNVTVTALNSSGSTMFQLSITVLAPPSSFSYNSPQTYVVGIPISPLSPAITGSTTSFSVAPALPAGLSLNAASGQIAGTPTTATSVANYLITAQGPGGASTFLLSIAVLIPPPSGLSYPSPRVFTVGIQIAPLNPTVNGNVASYSVTPALPAGLTLNPVTGQITGAPSAASSGANYVVRATNSSGIALASLFITVLIPAPSALSYPSPQIFTATIAIQPVVPV